MISFNMVAMSIVVCVSWDCVTTLYTADYNDNWVNLYSLNLNMELNIPKCQCSFT